MIGEITALLVELGALAAVVTPLILSNRKVSEGVKCQLRSEMLRIYYHHHEIGELRQYEYENFVMLYEAYKVLKGNSFIDKIYSEVKTWEIVT